MVVDLMDLSGKVALITGAGSKGGQGAAEARLFIEHGARVVVADLPSSQGAEVVADLGSEALFVELDVTDEASWTNAVTAATEDLPLCARFNRLAVTAH